MGKNKKVYTGPYIARKRVNKGLSDEDKELIQRQPIERLKFKIGMTSTEYLAVCRDIIARTQNAEHPEVANELRENKKSKYALTYTAAELKAKLEIPIPPVDADDLAIHNKMVDEVLRTWGKEKQQYKNSVLLTKHVIFNQHCSPDVQQFLHGSVPAFNNMVNMVDFMELLLQKIKEFLGWDQKEELDSIYAQLKDLGIPDFGDALKYMNNVEFLIRQYKELKIKKEVSELPVAVTSNNTELMLRTTEITNRADTDLDSDNDVIGAIYFAVKRHGVDDVYKKFLDNKEVGNFVDKGFTPYKKITKGGITTGGLKAMISDLTMILHTQKRNNPSVEIFYVNSEFKKPLNVGVLATAIEDDKKDTRKEVTKHCTYCRDTLFVPNVAKFHTKEQCIYEEGNKKIFVGKEAKDKRVQRAIEFKANGFKGKGRQR
jgi:hypothetical protein